MKKCFLVLPLLLMLVMPLTVLAQIPNASFENWTGAAEPFTLTSWFTNNLPGFPPYVPAAIPVTRSTTAHTGTYAVQGTVVGYSYGAEGAAYEPWIQAYFGYTGRPGSLTGWYKYTPVAHDTLQLAVELFSNNLSQVIAVADWGLSPAAVYTKFTAPLEYISAGAPDSVWVWFIIGPGDNDTLHLGSTFLLDDLAFEGQASGIDASTPTPLTFALQQNYPNPFNPSTTIRYTLPEASHVRLSVYNLLGEEIAVLVNEQRQAGVYDQRFEASSLPSGTYFYRIEAQGQGAAQSKSYVQVRKMTIVK